MGLLSTRWEASYAGHNITVSRSELTRGFSIEWDAQEIARRAWSLVGLGHLHGTAELDGKDVDVHVSLQLGGEGFDGSCTITVDGKPVEALHKIR